MKALGYIAFLLAFLVAFAAGMAYVWFTLFGGELFDLFQRSIVGIILFLAVVILAAEIRNSYLAWKRANFRRLMRDMRGRKALRILRQQKRSHASRGWTGQDSHNN